MVLHGTDAAQAAATGERETIMDEELSRLAKRNLAKFQQLNQRMQVGGRRLFTGPCSKGPGHACKWRPQRMMF